VFCEQGNCGGGENMHEQRKKKQMQEDIAYLSLFAIFRQTNKIIPYF